MRLEASGRIVVVLSVVASVVLSSADSCRNIHIYAGYILMQ